MAAANRVNINALPRHPDFGLPTMETQVYLSLPVLPEGEEETSVTKVVVEDQPVLIINEIYANIYCQELIQIILGNEVGHYERAVYVQRDPIQFPENYTALLVWHKMYDGDTRNTHVQIPSNRNNFGFLISLFAVYPEFAPSYNLYMQRPDNTINPVQVPSYVDQLRGWERPTRPTEQDIKATCHLIMLLMAKRFPGGANITVAEHIQNFLANRLRAIGAILDEPGIKWLCSPQGLETLNSVWNELPKLRETLFQMAFRSRNKYPDVGGTMTLLSEASMVTLRCIKVFMEASEKSMAHAHPTIWEEQVRFMQDCTRKKQGMGSQWVYYRVLHPKDTDLSASKYPNLARAAVLFYKNFVDTSETFRRVVVPSGATIPGLDSLAGEPLRPIYLREGAESAPINNLSDQVREFAANAGFDLENWLPPARALRRMHADVGFGLEDDLQLIRGARARRNINPNQNQN